MGYPEENQILLYEELCGKPVREDEITRATIRFRENIKLVYHLAKKYSEPIDAAISKEDIVQEGFLALWKACIQFDDSKGYKFSTYAVPVINGSILRMLRDNEALRTPRSFKDIRSTLNSHGFTLPLTEEEMEVLLEEKKFSRKQIIECTQYTTISLDADINDIDNMNLSNIIPDAKASDFYKNFSEDDIERLVDSVLEYIKPKHRDLVEEWIYASLEGCKLTQKELAIKYDVSQVKISRILNSAISVLKMCKSDILDLFGI